MFAPFGFMKRPSSGGIANPLAISGCDVWLRSDLGISQSGGFLTGWANQGTVGSAGNAAQATGAARPAYSASGGINSRASIVYNGSSQFLNWSYAPASSGAKTVYVIVKLGALPHTGYSVATIATAGLAYSEVILDLSTYQTFSFVADNGSPMSGLNPTLNTSGHIYMAAYAGSSPSSTASYAMSYDGTISTTNTSGAYGGTGASAIGARSSGSFFSNADIPEIAVYNRQLNITELGQLHAYAHATWGI